MKSQRTSPSSHRGDVIAALALGICATAFWAVPAVAQVSDDPSGKKLVDFCANVTNEDCYVVEIKNASSATVMSTVIDQNLTGGVCEKDSVRVQKNVTGNNIPKNSEIDAYIYATLNPACAYEVKFNVSNGCTGDTRARVKSGKKPATILLDKNCGTLKTIKNYG